MFLEKSEKEETISHESLKWSTHLREKLESSYNIPSFYLVEMLRKIMF